MVEKAKSFLHRGVHLLSGIAHYYFVINKFFSDNNMQVRPEDEAASSGVHLRWKTHTISFGECEATKAFDEENQWSRFTATA